MKILKSKFLNPKYKNELQKFYFIANKSPPSILISLLNANVFFAISIIFRQILIFCVSIELMICVAKYKDSF